MSAQHEERVVRRFGIAVVVAFGLAAALPFGVAASMSDCPHAASADRHAAVAESVDAPRPAKGD